MRPVGEARGFIDIRAAQLAGERLIARRLAEAADHRGDLGIEDRRRHLAREVDENLDVLACRVKDLEDVRIGQQREERRQVDAFRHRIDRHRFVGPADLHEAQDRPIGPVAHELGIDGNEGGLGLALAVSGELGRIGDQGHGLAIQ